MSFTLRRGLLPLALLALVPAACTKPVTYYSLQGRIVENGKPWKPTTEGLPPGDHGVSVLFCPLDEGGRMTDAYNADVNPADGSFTILGPAGKGLAEGKYKVTVHVGAVGTPDKLKGALGEATSPLQWDVPGGGETVVIDIGKKTISKQ